MMSTSAGIRSQYFTVIVANLVALSYGITMGWASPVLPQLLLKDSPLSFGPITLDDVANCGALFCLGGSLGTILFGYIADRFGRKIGVYFCAVPLLISWVLKIVAVNVYFILTARFLAGFAGAGTFLVIPIFVTEITDDRVRGSLGTFLTLFCSVGILLGYISGGYLSYYTIAYLAIIIPVVFMILFYRSPDTPLYLLSKNRHEEAKAAMDYYRGEVANEKIVSSEFLTTPQNAQTDDIDDGVTWADFTTPAAKKAIVIFTLILFMTQLSGIFLINNYMTTIFAAAKSSLSPTDASIAVAVLQLTGTAFSAVVVDRAGRKILLILSALLTGLCLLILGIYLYLSVHKYDVSAFMWLPILCVAGTMFNASWGVLPIPFCMGGEILSQKIRNKVISAGLVFCWFIGLLLLKYFHILIDIIGLHGCMILFAGFCLFESVFVLVYVPETKGKSIDEILRILGGSKKM